MLVPLLCAWLALAPNGDTLFIAREQARQIVFFDAGQETVAATVALPSPPSGIAAGDSRLYATADGEVHIVDISARKVAGRIAAGRGATSPVISRDGSTLYVCNRFDDTVSVIDLARRRETATVAVSRQPCAAALTPDGRWLYVATLLPDQPSTAEHIAAKVCVIDTESARAGPCISLPNGSTGVRGLAISPDGKHAFVTHILARYTVHTTQLEQGWINTNALSIIDVASQKLLTTVLLDDVDNGAANPWAVGCTADGRYVCVTHAGTHELSIIDFPALLAEVAGYEGDPSNQLSFLIGCRRRIKLGGKGPRALAIAGSRVWVAEYFTDTISSVSLEGRPTQRTHRLAPEKPLTEERRGEMLFNDAGLCFQHWQSCASCHPDVRVDGLNWDLLNDGIGNPKNTKSLLLSHQTPPAMWTGTRPNAENAVRSGLRHIEFTLPRESEASAIDEYLKSLKPAPSPHRAGEAAERGRKLFFSEEVGCAGCHPPPLYTDGQLHDVGTHARFDFTTDADGRRVPQLQFNTPSLIEAWRTAPYLHDGRHATIKEAITTGNHGDLRGRTSHLSEKQVNDLVQFILSL